MIKLISLLFEGMIPSDLERFREPLRTYMLRMFPKEYDPKQLLMFGLSLNDLIDIFLNKILSIKIKYEYGREGGELPSGNYNNEKDEIEISGINFYSHTSYKYIQYVDSVIYHELIHAVNFHKKLFDKVTYDILMLGDTYYSDPEEVRAYTSQIKDFLIGHLGFTRKQAEDVMNRFSSDRSSTREKWIAKYYDLQEIEYPLAGKEDLQSYGGMAGWKGKIVWMSPDKFLSLASPLIDPISHTMKDLEDKMKRSHPIDFLLLKIDVDRNKVVGHEGRHRATVAKKLGIEKVPVLIWPYKYKGEEYPRVPKWTKQQHDYADKAEFEPEWDYPPAK